MVGTPKPRQFIQPRVAQGVIVMAEPSDVVLLQAIHAHPNVNEWSMNTLGVSPGDLVRLEEAGLVVIRHEAMQVHLTKAGLAQLVYHRVGGGP